MHSRWIMLSKLIDVPKLFKHYWILDNVIKIIKMDSSYSTIKTLISYCCKFAQIDSRTLKIYWFTCSVWALLNFQIASIQFFSIGWRDCNLSCYESDKWYYQFNNEKSLKHRKLTKLYVVIFNVLSWSNGISSTLK